MIGLWLTMSGSTGGGPNCAAAGAAIASATSAPATIGADDFRTLRITVSLSDSRSFELPLKHRSGARRNPRN